MNRGSDRRSALATTIQLLIVAILAIAVFVQVGRLANDGTSTGISSVAPVDVAVVDDESGDVTPYVTTDDVNLRSGPGTSHAVMQVLPVQTGLAVTGNAMHGFAPVRVDGTAAWVAVAYIAPAGSVLASTMSLEAEPAVMSVSETLVAGELVSEPDSEPEPLTELSGERWVEVDRSTATITLHHGETVVTRFQGLIGRDPSADGYYSTATGTFHVFSKEKALTETPFAPGVYLTDFVGFDPERSNGFHSPTRDKDGNVVQTGGTVTMGCVRLGEEEAQLMFDFAFIGMRVEIHD